MDQGEAARGVPRLVLAHGREKAREEVAKRVGGGRDLPLVDIAAGVLADEAQRIGISYSGFCLTSLPHKRLPDEQPWEKKGHRVTLLVEPGRLRVGGRTVLYGVPYGARARLILLYLMTQSVRTGSREVELGRSMRDWLTRMGLSVGGETARALREQAARVSACSLKFFWDEGAQEGFQRGAIVRSGLRFHADGDDEEGRQGKLWDDRVTLDEGFWDMLRAHPVPLLESAIRQLRDRSMSLDLYIWLAWRLQHLGQRTPISWAALHGQFGAGYRQVRQFKPRFVEALAAATAAYPDARVEVAESGVVLHPSKPPVPRLAA